MQLSRCMSYSTMPALFVPATTCHTSANKSKHKKKIKTIKTNIENERDSQKGKQKLNLRTISADSHAPNAKTVAEMHSNMLLGSCADVAQMQRGVDGGVTRQRIKK